MPAQVCFSRKKVLDIARRIHRANEGADVGVLYGAMPPPARAKVMREIARGEVNVMVTTDVIGHGLNLPIDTVVLAEDRKFDGAETRPLRVWEAAQIVGRAGRGDRPGDVLPLRVEGYAAPSAARLERFVAAANGAPIADLAIEHGYYRPSLRDLRDIGGDSVLLLPHALRRWARGGAAPSAPWIRKMNVNRLAARLEALAARLPEDLTAMPPCETYWRLAQLPMPDDCFERVARHVLDGEAAALPTAEQLGGLDRERLEAQIRYIDAAALAAHAFPDAGLLRDAPEGGVGALMDAAAEALLGRLQDHLEGEDPPVFAAFARARFLDEYYEEYYDEYDDGYYEFD